MKCGFWNVRGWASSNSSDKPILRSECIKKASVDVIGLAETHLRDNETIHLEGYNWIGQNRQVIHRKARCGSGGIGLLVKRDIGLTHTILDDSIEGILWVSLYQDELLVVNICVCYLPPEYSSRAIDASEFYEQLLTQVYCYQKNCDFIICGDINSRCGFYRRSR